MIVLPCLSQITYQIDGNKVVCYTLDENRRIAIFLAQRDYYEQQYNNQVEQIENYIKVVNSYKGDSAIWNKIKVLYEDHLTKNSNKLDSLAIVNQKQLNKINRKNNWIKGLSLTSIVSTGLLIILML